MIDNKNIRDNTTEWKRINMRNVAHLLGVEFIHDLYNRHEPKINSIRFRHTITIWKDGVVNSYAPTHEWDRLGELLGEQYYSLNPSLLEHTKLLYARKRKHYHKFIRTLRKVKFKKLSSQDLATTLVQFQSIVLGELYVLNFVQVEHGLNIAIKRLIAEIIPDKDKIEDVFVTLIKTAEPTASRKEKRRFNFLIWKWKLLRKLFIYNEARARKDVEKHCLKYQYLYSAYGEIPKSFDDFWSSFKKCLATNPQSSHKLSRPFLINQSKKMLRKFKNAKLNVLIPLLIQGGIFRDSNKGLLGRSVKYRFEMLDEIARRGLETRLNLNYYLLSEITDLLLYSKKVHPEEITLRNNHGIVFTRFEDFQIYKDNILPMTPRLEQQNKLQGFCASQGECIGHCKIVLTKKDADKVETGDIMVAIGTDFDLIEAMYRSAAVITEEGGILSHASVVCRELDKPCCIGVKNATQLLKDGQLLKVEATRGMITILQ